MTAPELQWYAVYTQARMEKWARSNLWERGFEVYLPQYRRQRRHARKTDWVSAPLFPRYLFVSADPENPGQRSINSAPGVINLVSFGERFATISDQIIQAIRAREDAAGHVKLVENQHPETRRSGAPAQRRHGGSRRFVRTPGRCGPGCHPVEPAGP